MRTLGIKLRLIRTMQTNNLMPHQVPPRLQILRHRLTPQTRTTIPPAETLLEPCTLFNSTFKQPFLPDLEPRCGGAVEGAAVVGVVSAVCEPGDHGADSVHPVCVDGGDVLACGDGDV